MLNPKIVGMYRVKNEARFIEQSLKSVMDICSEIIVLVIEYIKNIDYKSIYHSLQRFHL